ncbi:CPBP family intramembrane glutamic endopeptidase [Larkinella soli]|uniref:CPBP family intramembrane glutamic endopeptidase n=1 Tax=Larkinella soli TaxID=1770527 RepID=UPI000FFBF03D|nr:CPBP family intramembrane glutamic endopeptidase [Larkinella soli]
MRTIIRYLRDYLKADFRPDLYAVTAVFLAACIGLNYYLDFEDSYIDAYRGQNIRIVYYFLLYAFAYYTGVGLWTRFHGQTEVWQSRDFWLYSLFGLAVYAVYAGFYGFNDWSHRLLDGAIYRFAFYCLRNLHSLVTVLLPLLLFYWFAEKEKNGFYGMRPKWKGLRIYFILLLCMAPLITYASFQPSFLETYPTYRDTEADEFFNVPTWVTAVIYELAYGWDFVPTELMFRGFLVIGMSRILGRGAVLPMVVTYAFIHFGKPPGETISSIFGGYILGVIALRTRSIWGGIIIHLGVAWLMELAAFIQLAFQS